MSSTASFFGKHFSDNGLGTEWAEGGHERLIKRLEAERARIFDDEAWQWNRASLPESRARHLSDLLARVNSFGRLDHIREYAYWCKEPEDLLPWLTPVVAEDELYEQLLADPRIVRSILRVLAAQGTLPADCIERLDFEGMFSIPPESIGSEFQMQHINTLWRIPVGDITPPAIYLLIQYQPHPDPKTRPYLSEYAARICAVASMKELHWDNPSPSPVLPVVLRGTVRDSVNISPRAQPGSVAGQIEAVVGNIRHLALDIRACELDDLPRNEPMSSWIRMVRARTVQELLTALQDANRTIHDRQFLYLSNKEFADLPEVFLRWATNSVWKSEKLLPPDNVLRAILNGEVDDITDWGTKDFYSHAQDKGLEEGREQGLEQGREEGHRQGMDKMWRKARRSAENRALEQHRTMLCSLAESRFGDETSGRLSDLLAPIDSYRRLTEVGKSIVTCESGEELLTRIEKERSPRAARDDKSSG